MKTINLIFNLLFYSTIFCQTQYADVNYLIPYNDHGKWGWSDTLGDIKIKPKYEKTGFFHAYDSIPEAYVKIKGIHNSYLYNNGLKVPKTYKTIKEIFLFDENRIRNRDLIIVESKKNKLGIYDKKAKKFILKPIYSSIESIGVNNLNVLYKREKEQFFSLLYFDEIYKHDLTDILKIQEWEDENNIFNHKQLYQHTDSTWTYFDNGVHIIEDFKKEDSYPEGMVIVDFDQPKQEEELKTTNNIDGLIDSYDYSKYPEFYEEYGFIKLKIVRKDGEVGMINENDSIIIPFEYDKIFFNVQNPSFIKLIKGNKEGVKLLFTTYPIIPAKYDKIINFESPIRIRVSKNWHFIVFLIEINGQEGYVGENSIEYFNLN